MLNPQMKRGLLEVCVLSALSREGSYGYKIIRDVSDCIEISESTLYPILKRLESSGMVTAHSVEHNGRLRKIYEITDSGLKQIDDFIDDWHELEAVYEYIKEGKGLE